jgi:putative hydrolase of the HAD superfamily
LAQASSTLSATKQGTLGLLTFDLDDSLYPIDPVLKDANNVFVKKMANYGYSINPQDIVEAGKRIRASAGKNGVAMSHTDVRLKAIRSEMERKMLEKKLAECAEDWATEVRYLTAPLKESAKKWAKSAVSQSVVESIYSAWERERHHSAERHLYPEIITALQTIREQHPNVVIGAVTDGKANPMLMVFSLAPYFDFCLSWEDDAAGRTEFYKELGNVDGNADLQWIYKAAVEKGKEIADAKKQLKKDIDLDDAPPVWIHVGDDLAYDVGGSASCGAKTILLDLDKEYQQTAKLRFPPYNVIPAWNTAPEEEIAHRKAMNDEAKSMIDKKISRLSMLPDAINEILNSE